MGYTESYLVHIDQTACGSPTKYKFKNIFSFISLQTTHGIDKSFYNLK